MKKQPHGTRRNRCRSPVTAWFEGTGPLISTIPTADGSGTVIYVAGTSGTTSACGRTECFWCVNHRVSSSLIRPRSETKI